MKIKESLSGYCRASLSYVFLIGDKCYALTTPSDFTGRQKLHFWVENVTGACFERFPTLLLLVLVENVPTLLLKFSELWISSANDGSIILLSKISSFSSGITTRFGIFPRDKKHVRALSSCCLFLFIWGRASLFLWVLGLFQRSFCPGRWLFWTFDFFRWCVSRSEPIVHPMGLKAPVLCICSIPLFVLSLAPSSSGYKGACRRVLPPEITNLYVIQREIPNLAFAHNYLPFCNPLLWSADWLEVFHIIVCRCFVLII